ncbi:GNAT family N-acetyltransferase [Phytoactinopolyspora limicola]|uniref:GNAT family N-acetyltransferase n=1 Tax=Phytoactinopolyspora limicola TaxID=2715536 RepID=UPI00140800D9|nr:GNAT family N-acetyltransferase [Phytoactinopolyspora limicola]
MVELRNLEDAHVDELSHVFAGWPKSRAQFIEYAEMVRAGTRDVIVAWSDSGPIGYLTIAWDSAYPPFAAAGIPEVVDFNVLALHRRRGVGATLMDEAEHRIARRSEHAGIGVGLNSDYGNAQRMYVKRGYIPDGAGVVLGGHPVAAGTIIALDDRPSLMFTKQL